MADSVTLELEGMTCAACATRIEKKLNRLEGVEAAVNFATERAKIDTKMIGHGQQVVAGYSVRPLPGAPVATPLRWDEVGPALDPRALNLRTVPQRVAELGDLHEPLLHGRQRLAIRTRLRHKS